MLRYASVMDDRYHFRESTTNSEIFLRVVSGSRVSSNSWDGSIRVPNSGLLADSVRLQSFFHSPLSRGRHATEYHRIGVNLETCNVPITIMSTTFRENQNNSRKDFRTCKLLPSLLSRAMMRLNQLNGCIATLDKDLRAAMIFDLSRRCLLVPYDHAGQPARRAGTSNRSKLSVLKVGCCPHAVPS